MKKTLERRLVVVAVLALITGCARSESPAKAHVAASKTAPEPQRLVAAPTPEGMSQTVEVRILGYDPGAFTSVLLDVPDLTASAAGVALTVTPGEDRVDLAQTQQSWLLGRVTVPAGANQVDFTLAFDDAGGFEAPGEAGRIDSRHVSISWSAPVESLRENGHAVVVLDLTDSLVSTGTGGRALIPRLVIQY